MTLVLWNVSFGLAPLPSPLPDLRIYGWIYDAVPVARGIRVPARAALFVSLGLSLLAGFGLAWLLPTVARWTAFRRAGLRLGLASGGVFTLLVTGVSVAESVSIPFISPAQIRLVNGPDPVAQWLAAQPGRAPIVELPMLLHTREEWFETNRMLNGMFHWRPLLNGYRGFVPANLKELSRRLEAFPEDDTLAILNGLGVEFVILRRFEGPAGSFERLAGRARARGLVPVASFETAEVYRVPIVSLAGREKATVELEAPLHVRPGEQAEAWLILGNSDRAPFIPRIAEPYRVTVRWVAEGGSVAEKTLFVPQPLLVPAGDVVETPVVIDVPRWNGPVRLIVEAQGELAGAGQRIEQDYTLVLR
jgi:hypothetical protein